ncbi:hypothetical protein GBC03_06490 [Citrobacter telavivensis]|uniref:Uncharacterized protein n=1 Tax=Citrobacter telavivensis TaxID=2653932 RepID=A0A6L5EDB0_9ENTR|nr:hypothetical protein [Citrobacter telavivensis]QFS69875.1 hypothetical protein GBC03_06490 [Citrobacter telavivensis]
MFYPTCDCNSALHGAPFFLSAGWRRCLIRPTRASVCRPDKRSAIRQPRHTLPYPTYSRFRRFELHIQSVITSSRIAAE